MRHHSIKTLIFQMMMGKTKDAKPATVHALKDIGISIRSGEKVGLIGRNGAGKSSLLRVIAGIYPVSSGTIQVEGKIRSLFGIATGFEPDATGRENILYRGLLLGLTPEQIRKLQDQIIEFADIGEFIDYPIKTYSAGMTVRLAFAISTSLSGDILLIDEVIGAGDANFMRKAKLRIRQLMGGAEIVVIASHDFHIMKEICSRGILMHRGSIVFDGDVNSAIEKYQAITR